MKTLMRFGDYFRIRKLKQKLLVELKLKSLLELKRKNDNKKKLRAFF